MFLFVKTTKRINTCRERARSICEKPNDARGRIIIITRGRSRNGFSNRFACTGVARACDERLTRAVHIWRNKTFGEEKRTRKRGFTLIKIARRAEIFETRIDTGANIARWVSIPLRAYEIIISARRFARFIKKYLFVAAVVVNRTSLPILRATWAPCVRRITTFLPVVVVVVVRRNY